MKSAVAFLVAALIIAGFASTASATAASAAAPAQPRTLTVTGQGETSAVPDEARLSTGVVTQGHTAADALAANSRVMNQVFATLKQAGIPEKSIQTSEFSVSPQYLNDGNGNRTEQITGYQVSNSVTVIVDDLSRLGPTLDALVSSGSNSLGGVEFTIRDPRPLMTGAREAAMKDAIAKADIYAHAGGFQVGKILSVNEAGSAMPRPMFSVMSKAASAPPPIAAGQQTLSASVSVTFQIQ
ncbi:MAG: SIMPL domain-containing protein [Rhizomicrobium sp.]|jgi:uncharacterized protein YggE